MCVRGIDVSSVSTVFILDFGTVNSDGVVFILVGFFLLIFIHFLYFQFLRH